jgi:hypothetical protein
MKSTIAILAAAISVAAYSPILQADPQSVEATEHAAKAEYKAAKKHANADYKASGCFGACEMNTCVEEN